MDYEQDEEQAGDQETREAFEEAAIAQEIEDRHMSYDLKCEELAVYFFSEGDQEEIADLAQHIQDAIEDWLLDGPRTPQRKCAEQPRRRHRVEGCEMCASFGDGMGPSHDASRNCESGKSEHCTCDMCF